MAALDGALVALRRVTDQRSAVCLAELDRYRCVSATARGQTGAKGTTILRSGTRWSPPLARELSAGTSPGSCFPRAG